MTDHYDRCRACYSGVVGGHVFKPKRMTVKGLLSRAKCPCLCHWGNMTAGGITFDQALQLYNKTHPNKPIADIKVLLKNR